jgi:phosphatidate cytidylyltransferase
VKDLRRRTVTAAVYAAVVVAAVFAPPIVFAALLVAAAVVAILELVGLRQAGGAVLVELIVLMVGLSALYFLRTLGEPAFVLLVIILAIWAEDVVAYLVGSRFGRHKIAPRISPGKTWEGTIAGFVAAAIVVLASNLPFGLNPVTFLIAALIGPAGFAGDLVESWIKRRAGVKDSGALFPGHGGMLDRIDSLIMAAPFVAAAIVLAGRMG